MKYNLAIIGGGAAGMMAAISACDHHPDWKVVIIEKNASMGRKILVTGAGRCNLTNVNLANHGEEHYNQPEFVKKVLVQFGYKEIMNFFTELGLKVVEEKKNNTGKIFPVSDQASSVVDLLVDYVVSRGVRVEKETVCREIKKSEGQFNLVLQSADKKWELMAAKVILAAGGKTYPALGADGTGFSLAEKFGHKIISPVPSGVPLEGKDRLAQELQGLKLPAEIRLSKDKKVVGDLLFTKYGLSGMAVLLSSRILSRELNSMNKKGVQIELNFMPDYNLGIAIDFWLARKEKYPSRLIEVDWAGVFPTKFAKAFLKLTGLAGRNYATVSSVELKKAVKLLVAYPWHLTATRGWNEAEFTAGGVDCTEINPSTLESKKIPGLYFAGEIMDIDGDIGGYNLSWAWASGFVAGKTA